MIRWVVAALLAAGSLHAQAMKNDAFHLDNGAVVFYQTYSQLDLTDRARMFGTTRAYGNTIARTMTDGSNRTWLGFELQIARLPGDPIRFRISMGPMNQWGFFGRRAPPREIQNGDRVLLDVLEEPGTGRKIYDTFQVGIGVDMQMMPMAKSVPQVPAAGAVIHLQSPSLDAAKAAASVSGALVNVRVLGKGRFSFSSSPQPGFRMEAIAEGNRVMFVAGNAAYNVDCAAPVMDAPGAWYLWVRHDPSPNAPVAPEVPLQ